MVRKDGARIRCFTKGGHDWASRFPAIVEGRCPRPGTQRTIHAAPY
jgi:ATP-dependent DNA ligase